MVLKPQFFRQGYTLGAVDAPSAGPAIIGCLAD